MTMRFRTGLMLIVAVATMVLASCGHYVCGANFGNSTCAAGPVTLSGGTGSTAAAFVFVANGTGAGTVVGYTLDTNATPPTLTATADYTAPSTPNEDAGLGMAVAQKQFLYTAFGSTGQIYGWSISTTGTLTAVPGSPYTAAFANVGSSVFDTHRVATNPAGTLLFVADEFLDEIFVYQIGSGGVLAAVTGSPFSVPFSPGNMTTDGLGNYLYITETFSNHTGSEVGAYSIGTGGNLGVLTQVAGSPFAFPMWQVAGEPTGQFLVGTKGLSQSVNGADDDTLYVFSITQSGASAGAITQVSTMTTTNSPFSIAVQSNSGGNLVYTFGLDDLGDAFNPVEGYALNSGGTLTIDNGSPFEIADVGTEGQFDQSGGLLFVYGGVFEVNTVVYSVTALEVSGSNLTVPTPSGTYGGFWVTTDPQ
jgi:6-phosphogluconolactonase (cycloisomerase 2 family)